MVHCGLCGTYLPRICRYCVASNSTGRYWDPKESSLCELELTILGIVERSTSLGASDLFFAYFECSNTLNVHKKVMLFWVMFQFHVDVQAGPQADVETEKNSQAPRESCLLAAWCS